MKQWVILTTILLLTILLLAATPSAAFAKALPPINITAPYDSTVTLTYLGNPVYQKDEIMDYEPPALLTVGEPYNVELGMVGSEKSTGGNYAGIGYTYNLGSIGQGQEVEVNLTDAESVYSTKWTQPNPYPGITRTQVSDDVTNYSVFWYGFIYSSSHPGGRNSDYGQLYDYPLNVTFTRAGVTGSEPMSNTTAVRDFYTNVYPHMWSGPTFKIPLVAVMDSNNKVSGVIIKSSWDPATIGMTRAQVDECILNIYGVLPTYK